MSTVAELRQQVLHLSDSERELLAIELLGSLEPGHATEAVQAAWSAEIMSRSDALHAGTVQTLDAEESLALLRQRLAARIR
jgi:putative addiction module component (TIGR02574 family)